MTAKKELKSERRGKRGCILLSVFVGFALTLVGLIVCSGLTEQQTTTQIGSAFGPPAFRGFIGANGLISPHTYPASGDGTPDTVDVDAQEFAVGAQVEYFSATASSWIPARVQGKNADGSGTYNLDCKPLVRPDRIRNLANKSGGLAKKLDGGGTKANYPVNAQVEYFSGSLNQWISARIISHNADGTYNLDCKPWVAEERIRWGGGAGGANARPDDSGKPMVSDDVILQEGGAAESESTRQTFRSPAVPCWYSSLLELASYFMKRFASPDEDLVSDEASPDEYLVSDENLVEIALEFKYNDIKLATEDFSTTKILREEKFGRVYEGEHRGQSMAIKVLDAPDEAGFLEEVQVLSKFRQKNLVTLLGFARGTDKTRYLVYEKLEMDLFSWLRPETWKTNPFSETWEETPKLEQKLNILYDVALGLSHLHHGNPNAKVFHRDIKTQNIMLDRNGRAKMVDFGSALLVSSIEGNHEKRLLTEGNEVYSFGMVILEVLTRTPPVRPSLRQDGSLDYHYKYSNSTADIIIQEAALVNVDWPRDLVCSIVKFAFSCIVPVEEQRPSFVEIVGKFRAWLENSKALQ